MRKNSVPERITQLTKHSEEPCSVRSSPQYSPPVRVHMIERDEKVSRDCIRSSRSLQLLIAAAHEPLFTPHSLHLINVLLAIPIFLLFYFYHFIIILVLLMSY